MVDDPPTPCDDEVLFDQLDRYVCALQQSDERLCQQLLADHPEIQQFIQPLNQLDGFLSTRSFGSLSPARVKSRVAGTNDFPLQTEAKTDSSLTASLDDFLLVDDFLRSQWSTTWRAKVIATERPVAITFLSPRHRLSEKTLERLLRVGQIRGSSAGGQLVRVTAAGMSQGLQFLVLDRISGRPLSERVGSVSLDAFQAARIVASVARDVEAILSCELSLIDLDPEQILVDDGGRVFLTDYWCTLGRDGEATIAVGRTLSALAGLLATLVRFPPRLGGPTENLRSINGLDPRMPNSTDHSPPGDLRTNLDVRVTNTQRSSTYQPASDLDNTLLPLVAVCRHCRQALRGGGYKTVGEFAADLERFLAGQPILAPSPTIRERVSWWLLEEPTLGPRVVTVATALFLVLFFHFLEDKPWSYHGEIKVTFVFWGALSFIMRFFSVRRNYRAAGRMVWILTDIVCGSYCLTLVEPDAGPLYVVYPLVQVIVSLWQNAKLIAVSTIASLVAFSIVLWVRSEPVQHPQYPALVIATIVFIGLFLRRGKGM